MSVLEVRNKIHAGDEFEVLSPDGTLKKITMSKPLITKNNNRVDLVNHGEHILIDQNLKPYTILRRVQ